MQRLLKLLHAGTHELVCTLLRPRPLRPRSISDCSHWTLRGDKCTQLLDGECVRNSKLGCRETRRYCKAMESSDGESTSNVPRNEQADTLPQAMQLDDDEIKPQSLVGDVQASAPPEAMQLDAADPGNEQADPPPPAVQPHTPDDNTKPQSFEGSQQTGLPETAQHDRHDDVLNRGRNKKVKLVVHSSADSQQANPSGAVKCCMPYGGRAVKPNTEKGRTDVVTLKDIEAEPWYSISDGIYKEGCMEGSSAVPKLWTKVALYRGDITKLKVDAIVNAANSRLLGGGGVDGAIHAAAGRDLVEECRTLNGCSPGDAKITRGYRLPAKHVIHTVGPMDGDPEVLTRCYKRCLKVMMDHKLRSVAFPCIATGIYGFPNDEAADIALKVARGWLELHHADVDKIVFCVFLHQDFKLYKEKLPVYFSPELAKESESSNDGEDTKSSTSVAIPGVDGEAGNDQFEEQRTGKSEGSDDLPSGSKATAVSAGPDTENLPTSSVAEKPGSTDERAGSVAGNADDRCEPESTDDGAGSVVGSGRDGSERPVDAAADASDGQTASCDKCSLE